MTVQLFAHVNTSAHQINAPLFAKRGEDWFLVNGHKISRVATPAPGTVIAINDKIMFTAPAIKARVAGAK